MWLELARVLGGAPSTPVRQFGAGLDLARSTGAVYLWRRRRDEAARNRRPGSVAAGVYRTIWERAAAEVGAELDDLGSGFLELRSGSARTRVWRNWLELEDIVAHRLSLDKPRVHEVLATVGVTVPEHLEFGFRDLLAAQEFMRSSDTASCVVKPASGTSGGGGVTSGVWTAEDLVRARLRASRSDTRLLIERQVPGVAHRLLLLDGELLDAVRRRPPAVQGDGRANVGELIAAENRRRMAATGWRGFRLLTVDLDAVLTLARQGLDLSSIPAAGRWVTVKGVEGQNASHENETVREAVSEELVAEVARVGRTVGLRLVGVDLVAPDLSRPLRESGGAVIEANGTPGLQYHYLVAEPESATRVAVPILRRLLQERGG